MTVPIDAVFRKLATFPAGATSHQLAEALNLKPRNLAARLSKAFMYGKIDRDEFRVVDPQGIGHTHYVWRVKAA